MRKSIGPLAFLAGLLVAIVVGLLQLGVAGDTLLLFLGIVVGLLNIQPDEVVKYLVSLVALLFSVRELSVVLSTLPFGVEVVNIISALLVFLGSGAAVVALKTLIELARD